MSSERNHIDNFLTLKEVAEILGVEYHTLRASLSRHPERKEKYVVEKKNGWMIHKSLIEDYRGLIDEAS